MNTLAVDYPLLSLFWTMLWFFLFVVWIFAVFSVLADIFRSHDMGGWAKALWVLLVIVFPLLGVLIYLIVNHDGMADRNISQMQAQQAKTDEYIRSVSGGSAAEIEKAKGLLDSGAITQAEFDTIKQKALAS